MSFVDSGTVSFSNPVRQNLYNHDDAAKKREKATTAAARLKEIHPGIVRKKSNDYCRKIGGIVEIQGYIQSTKSRLYLGCIIDQAWFSCICVERRTKQACQKAQKQNEFIVCTSCSHL